MEPAHQRRPHQNAPNLRQVGASRGPNRPRSAPSQGGTRRPAAPPHGVNTQRRPSQNASLQRARRNKQRRRRRTAFIALSAGALLVLFLVIFLLVRLLGKKEKPVEAPAEPVASMAEVQAGGVAVSLPQLNLPAAASGPYDEAATPLLFNYDHSIPADYTSTLLAAGGMVDIGNSQKMEAKAAAAYLDMSAAAKADGVTLLPLSGYRSNQRQTDNYKASIQRYLDQGYSSDEAKSRTEGYYAVPGTSEHEAGLAIDIGDTAAPGSNIQDSFEKTRAFAWLQENSAKYGFILRYREEDFATTHIHYEPWHYRYVGANHAAVINQRNVTLEEYVLGTK